MYEEFRHPRVIAAKEQYDALVLARRTRIEEYLTEHDIPITEEIIEKYWRGYKRRLKSEFRSRLNNTGLYVFAELPIAFLDFNVPDALPWNTKTVDEVEVKWSANYWDGILSGMCVYNNEYCWFDICAEFSLPLEDEDYKEEDIFSMVELIRRFVIIELSEDQKRNLFSQHDRFLRDYRNTFKTIYLSQNKILGWVQDFDSDRLPFSMI